MASMKLQKNLHTLLVAAPMTVNEYKRTIKIPIMIKKTIQKIKTAKARLMLGVIMSSVVAAILSFVLTFSTIGFSPDFLSIWVHRLGLSLIVGPPTTITLFPYATKFVAKIAGASHVS